MILFTILLVALIVMGLSAALIIGVGGAAFSVIFADVIVCMAIIIWIMKKIFKRKKK